MLWFNFEYFFVITFAIGFFVNALPGLYLHLEYLNANKHLEYNISNNKIIIINNGFRKTYLANELEKIIVYMCPSVFKHSYFRSWAIEQYYYARIIAKNGDELIVTCLLTSEIEEVLKQLQGVEYIRRKELFCTLSLTYRG